MLKRFNTATAEVVLITLTALFWIVACGGGGGGNNITPAKVTVSGTVLDSSNNPVPFATVTIFSTPVTTTTDSSGYFEASVEVGDHTIEAVKNGASFINTSFSTLSAPSSFSPTTTDGYYPWYHDSDDDGYGDPYDVHSVIDSPSSPDPAYTSDFSDCDDTEILVNPGAAEICNSGVDDDCDGDADDADDDLTGAPTWYLDADSDTYYVSTLSQCISPGVDYSSSPGSGGNDCDDGDAAINPGASELCDGIDNDCIGGIDDGLTLDTFYADTDGDNYGDPAVATSACAAPAGYVDDDSDCDDTDDAINPGVSEICDGIDNDCSGTIDDGLTLDTFYADADGDTYGDAAMATSACAMPVGYVDNNTDCDDTDGAIHPGATEICNGGVDDDCDGLSDDADPGVSGQSTWYLDDDSDAYYVSTAIQCVSPGAGYSASSGLGGGDCDDSDADVHPGAVEVCNGGVDDDCDSLADDADPGVTGQLTWYLDDDSDTYGDPLATQDACLQPADYVSDNTDCDDTDAGINPGAAEIPNDGIDQDCTGGDLVTTGEDLTGMYSIEFIDYDESDSVIGSSVEEFAIYSNDDTSILIFSDLSGGVTLQANGGTIDFYGIGITDSAVTLTSTSPPSFSGSLWQIWDEDDGPEHVVSFINGARISTTIDIPPVSYATWSTSGNGAEGDLIRQDGEYDIGEWYLNNNFWPALFDPGEPIVDDNAYAGKTYDPEELDEDFSNATGVGSTAYHEAVSTTETVIVAAGTFNNVLHMRTTFSYDGVPATYKPVQIDRWFAQNIGPVYADFEDYTGGHTTIELSSYSIVGGTTDSVYWPMAAGNSWTFTDGITPETLIFDTFGVYNAPGSYYEAMDVLVGTLFGASYYDEQIDPQAAYHAAEGWLADHPTDPHASFISGVTKLTTLVDSPSVQAFYGSYYSGPVTLTDLIFDGPELDCDGVVDGPPPTLTDIQDLLADMIPVLGEMSARMDNVVADTSYYEDVNLDETEITLEAEDFFYMKGMVEYFRMLAFWAQEYDMDVSSLYGDMCSFDEQFQIDPLGSAYDDLPDFLTITDPSYASSARGAFDAMVAAFDAGYDELAADPDADTDGGVYLDPLSDSGRYEDSDEYQTGLYLTRAAAYVANPSAYFNITSEGEDELFETSDDINIPTSPYALFDLSKSDFYDTGGDPVMVYQPSMDEVLSSIYGYPAWAETDLDYGGGWPGWVVWESMIEMAGPVADNTYNGLFPYGMHFSDQGVWYDQSRTNMPVGEMYLGTFLPDPPELWMSLPNPYWIGFTKGADTDHALVSFYDSAFDVWGIVNVNIASQALTVVYTSIPDYLARAHLAYNPSDGRAWTCSNWYPDVMYAVDLSTGATSAFGVNLAGHEFAGLAYDGSQLVALTWENGGTELYTRNLSVAGTTVSATLRFDLGGALDDYGFTVWPEHIDSWSYDSTTDHFLWYQGESAFWIDPSDGSVSEERLVAFHNNEDGSWLTEIGGDYFVLINLFGEFGEEEEIRTQAPIAVNFVSASPPVLP